MAETIRDVAIKIALKQEEAKLKAPDTTAFKQALVERDKVVSNQAAKEIDSNRKVQESVDRTAEAERRVAREAESAAVKIVDANLKAADSYKMAGEGAFTFARGLAFLGTSTSESFEESLRTIAKFQGAFDVFKGGSDTIKGLIEGTRALKVATNTATAAQALHAAAIAVTGKAANIATASFLAMRAAMGGVGLAVAGVGVAVGVAATAWALLRDNIKETADALNKVHGSSGKLNELSANIFQQKLDLLPEADRLGAIRRRQQNVRRDLSVNVDLSGTRQDPSRELLSQIAQQLEEEIALQRQVVEILKRTNSDKKKANEETKAQLEAAIKLQRRFIDELGDARRKQVILETSLLNARE